MKNVIIHGASGNIARHVIDILAKKEGINLTLFLRNARRLINNNASNCRIIEGDVLDYPVLNDAIKEQDIVYEVDYETTRKSEPERGSVISQKSLATLIAEIIESPEKYVRDNLGVNKPNS
ncbi:MAG TPA: NAD(P)H-binding protein [Saprospiraceae bacterium]|nr:NAD(P)H-binding protein [Saprospiraceae bacterium]